ncbi:hypothetical protein N658DRAFT_284413 [Parathielavia hyrcaniae]|uniref:Uncharacterized protein n=1 Tax=Parathielavia hyrcaniae TaxID=113614 RepID=A0AAN6Q504_9PEZI|nr:hypothetical protein N658DRAFT_284413 [Parathielavia hyrcaniae]
MSCSPVTAMSGFPFALRIDGNLNSATANAIDTHLMEIAAIRNTVELDSKSSVLAVVTFPTDKGLSLACDGKPWQNVRMRMSYEKLLGLGSRKIEDMFAPRAQKRFRQRLGLEHQLPPGIEYVLDFTPPSEGPELADLTAALWLPRVVKLWFLAGHYIPSPLLEAGTGFPTRPLADKTVGAMLLLGHDDVCKGPACLSDYTSWQPKAEVPGVFEDPPDGPSHIPAWRKVEDYCPIRHRVAIVRILRAINGQGLLLNSAVRMWTVAQVAISLEIPQVVVDPVTQWLVAPPNTKFIEVCPEKAFQLAYALQIPSVLIAAFRLLVNERAIDYASSDPVPGRPPLTWAQRRRDDYGDYPSDPVEYASREFAERINGKFQLLQSDHIFSRLPTPNREWDKLDYPVSLITRHDVSHPVQEAYEDLSAGLLFAFRKWVNKALDLGPVAGRVHNLVEAQRSHHVPPWEHKPLNSLYATLNPAQKVLTPFFWTRLASIEHRDQFTTTPYGTKTLPHLIETFNTELRRALTDRPTILTHPPSSSSDIHTHTHPASLDLNLPIQFSLPEFHRLVHHGITTLAHPFLTSLAGCDSSDSGIPFFLSDHLLLPYVGPDEPDPEPELRYLPLWAPPGLDDGSGGVFQRAVPETDMGPSEPGPGYHTGYTARGGGSTVAGGIDLEEQEGSGRGYGHAAPHSTVFSQSDLGVGALSLGGGTSAAAAAAAAAAGKGGSLTVQRSVGVGSTATTTTVSVSVSGAPTPRSEAFTMDAAEDEGMYAYARYAQPAAHQAQGMAIERYVNEAEGGSERGDVQEGEEEEEEGEVDWGMELDEDEEVGFCSDDDETATLDGFEEVDVDEVR